MEPGREKESFHVPVSALPLPPSEPASLHSRGNEDSYMCGAIYCSCFSSRLLSLFLSMQPVFLACVGKCEQPPGCCCCSCALWNVRRDATGRALTCFLFFFFPLSVDTYIGLTVALGGSDGEATGRYG